MNYALLPFRRYFDFKGRSRRKEYWSYTILITVVNVVISFAERAAGLTDQFGENGPGSAIFSIVTFAPSLAVLVRRLHDTNRSGWWILAVFAPVVVLILALVSGLASLGTGSGFAGIGMVGGVAVLALVGMLITLLVFSLLDGTPGPNRYGPDPKQPTGRLDDVFA